MDEKKNVISNLIWKFAERITAQLVTVIVTIVLARILSTDEFGLVALIMVFITIANVFVSNGFGNALIQKKDSDDLDFSSVFYANIVISIIIYMILFFVAPYVASLYDYPALKNALRVLAIRIPVAAINSIQQAYVSRKLIFKKFFWSTFFGTCISGIVGVFLAYHGFGIWALVAQYLTNTIVDTIVLFITVEWKPKLLFSFDRVKTLLGFGWKLLVSGLIESTYTQIRSMLVGVMYTPSDLAFYNQGERYPSLLVTNINTSISSVLFPVLANNQNDSYRVKQMVRRSIQVSSYILWPMMIGLCVIAKPLVVLLFTEKWLPCVPFIQVFCISYGFFPIHTSNLQAINALGRSDLFLYLEIIKKVLGIIILIITVKISPFAIAVGLAASSFISIAINSFPNGKLLHYSFVEQMKDMLPPLIISSIMGVVVYLVSYFVKNNILLLITQLFMGAIIYVGLSIITKQEGFLYCKNIILSRKKK